MTNTDETTENTVELIQSGQFHNLYINDQLVVSYDEQENELVTYKENKNSEKAELVLKPENGVANT